MQPAGLAAFAQRSAALSGLYAHEQRHDLRLNAADEAHLRANPAAWAFFEAQSPTYRNGARHWVRSAKQEATRQRRLAMLIDHAACGLRLASL